MKQSKTEICGRSPFRKAGKSERMNGAKCVHVPVVYFLVHARKLKQNEIFDLKSAQYSKTTSN